MSRETWFMLQTEASVIYIDVANSYVIWSKKLIRVMWFYKGTKYSERQFGSHRCSFSGIWSILCLFTFPVLIKGLLPKTLTASVLTAGPSPVECFQPSAFILDLPCQQFIDCVGIVNPFDLLKFIMILHPLSPLKVQTLVRMEIHVHLCSSAVSFDLMYFLQSFHLFGEI